VAAVELTCSVCGATHVADVDLKPGQRFVFQCPDVDRRYRLVSFQVDGRRGIHGAQVAKSLADDDQKRLEDTFGSRDFEAKFRRWKNIAYPPIGLIDEYPEKIEQIINTYSMGYAYPAVTSSCCLAERILNRLVLRCRDHFKAHPEYRRIYRNQSFDDWGRMLGLIEDWQLISAKAMGHFRTLMPIRHQTIHYNDAYDFEAVAEAVINDLIGAISEIFGVMNRSDIYLLFNVPGEVWLRSQAESQPFVKEFVIPHCYRAHAVHDIDLASRLITERLGRVGPLTDGEFVELRNRSRDPVNQTV
jgi:hypothetical protein